MTAFSRLSIATAAASLASLPLRAMAQVYNGGGLGAGVNAGASLGLATGNPFEVLLRVLAVILSFMALIAVFTIVIAGIYMIISLGNDEQISKAKKIIKYTLIGLVIILFSRMMVGLVTNYLYGVAQ